MDHHAARGSLLRSFERHLRARNRSDRTVGNYLESARLAEAVLAARGKQLEEATQATSKTSWVSSSSSSSQRYRTPEHLPQPDGAHEATDYPRAARPNRP
jgi:hypothetical protein